MVWYKKSWNFSIITLLRARNSNFLHAIVFLCLSKSILTYSTGLVEYPEHVHALQKFYYTKLSYTKFESCRGISLTQMVSYSIITIPRMLHMQWGGDFLPPSNPGSRLSLDGSKISCTVCEGSARILDMFSWSVLIRQCPVAGSHSFYEHRLWVRSKLKGFNLSDSQGLFDFPIKWHWDGHIVLLY